MFQATASEVLVLKTIFKLSKNSSINSIHIEESEIFEILRSAQNDDKGVVEILKQVQNDERCALNDEIGLRTFKNALSGCIAKDFVQKLEKDGKTFYKITEDGLKQN